MLGRRALSSGRLAALGATLDFHHGLPGGARLVSLLARTCDATARGRRSSTHGWRRLSSATDVTQFGPAPVRQLRRRDRHAAPRARATIALYHDRLCLQESHHGGRGGQEEKSLAPNQNWRSIQASANRIRFWS